MGSNCLLLKTDITQKLIREGKKSLLKGWSIWSWDSPAPGQPFPKNTARAQPPPAPESGSKNWFLSYLSLWSPRLLCKWASSFRLSLLGVCTCGDSIATASPHLLSSSGARRSCQTTSLVVQVYLSSGAPNRGCSYPWGQWALQTGALISEQEKGNSPGPMWQHEATASCGPPQAKSSTAGTGLAFSACWLPNTKKARVKERENVEGDSQHTPVGPVSALAPLPHKGKRKGVIIHMPSV